MKSKIILVILITLSILTSRGQSKKYDSCNGLIMTGYQGWFNTPQDGAQRDWFHYALNGQFYSGACKFDMWPDMEEYKNKYPTPFKYEDGKTAYLFSSYDESTVDLHFKWMKEYGIDGVYLQRFIVTLKSESGKKHSRKVLESVLKAAAKYDRTVAIMYDLSGMRAEDYTILTDDWNEIIKLYKVDNRKKYDNYLFHNGKPLVAVWGIGFDDNRKYGLNEADTIIQYLKKNNCSIHLGVPTHWRTLTSDCINDGKLHSLIKQADIVHPWFVGRYSQETYPPFKKLIKEDIEWCKKEGIDYIPTIFPGFSWYNMKKNTASNFIPRNKGDFYWTQIAGAIDAGSEMLYLAMFDEIDEATAIFKCAHKVPVGESIFVPVESELQTDHYLWLSGMAGKILRKEISYRNEQPKR